MFKYTKAAINKTIDDIKLLINVISYITIAISFGYYVYCLIVNKGYLVFNIILLTLLLINFVFNFVVNKKYKKIKKVIKRSSKIIKLSINATTLALSIIGIITPQKDVTPITIIITTLLIIMFVVNIILTIVTMIVEDKIEFIMLAFKKDTDVKSKISGVFKKQENEYDVVVNKLDGYIEDKKELKRIKKLKEKQKRKEEKLAKKNKINQK